MTYISTTLSSLRRQITKFEYPNQQFLSLIQSCKSMNELKQIHAQIIRSDHLSNTFLATKLLEFCAISTRNNIDYALRVFCQIDKPNDYTWTTMIRSFVNIKHPKKAIEFYSLMISQGVEANKFTFIFVLKAYSLIPSF
ncbi:Pentatricopeptide repeat-containing protein [Thalictrum thalictroides]|uniref:Pentatricopeptide repeat-containing protein n=1 Tax=Thalictrum thalictroides TaxID=46969 RepID=A0A7J6VV41_THATH|nr:Pentatricopeptide repeat-containing protein [Thalictrum thalictroides]